MGGGGGVGWGGGVFKLMPSSSPPDTPCLSAAARHKIVFALRLGLAEVEARLMTG